MPPRREYFRPQERVPGPSSRNAVLRPASRFSASRLEWNWGAAIGRRDRAYRQEVAQRIFKQGLPHAAPDTLVRVLWDEQAPKFKARRVGDGTTADGDCIFSYVPIVLGRRLPDAIVQSITSALKYPGHLLTPYGLASEALNSPRYNGRSYVKGPVWAPPCAFIAEGLDAVGEWALASQIRLSFMNVCVQHGMYKHFDAQIGAPAGDPGYNRTAAMFQHFARAEGLPAWCAVRVWQSGQTDLSDFDLWIAKNSMRDSVEDTGTGLTLGLT